MKKVNLFNVSEVSSIENGVIFTREVYETALDFDNFRVFITFKIKPTDNTKIIFAKILEHYDPNTHSAEINRDNSYQHIRELHELDIIESMQFGIYEINGNLNDCAEIIIKYPVVIKYISITGMYRIILHEKFKDFFEKYFTLSEDKL